MQELKELATYAAQNNIRGGTFKRNSLLKPLDIILQELDRCPAPDNANELELVRAGTKGLIFDHLERIADAEYKPGRTKRDKVNHYVDLFFDGVLDKAHHGKVNRLLNRERLIRSAYLFYVREAIPVKSKVGVAAGATGDEDEEEIIEE
jgi:hypothetical protein